MKKNLFFGMIVLIMTGNLFADFSDGKYSGEFIRGSVDARVLSLGNLMVTSFHNSSAVFYNPAFLPYLDKQSVIFSHSERFSGLVKQEFAGFNTRLKSGHNIGIAFIRVGVDDIPITYVENGNINEENRPSVLRYASDNEFALLFSYGKILKKNFSLGGSIKLLGKFADKSSAYGVGFDVAAFYKFNENLKAGAKISDVTTSFLAWDTGYNEYIKPSLEIGGEYGGKVDYFLAQYKVFVGSRINTENYSENAFYSLGFMDFNLNLGMELLFRDIVFIRGGVENISDWSVGTGIKYFGFNLDYSFKPDYEDLGETHKISLAYNWGKF